MKKGFGVLKGICLIAILLLLMNTPAYAEPARFSVDLECGYDGYAKENEEVPLTLEIRNGGAAFEGSVRLSLSSYDSSTEYEAGIAIGAGETKRIRFHLPQGASAYSLATVIFNAGGIEFSQERDVFATYGTTLVGVLSDDYSALYYLAELRWLDQYGSLSKPKTVNLAKDLSMWDYNSINLLDAIVVNDFNLDQLTQSQAALLKGWVEQGGALLVGTGVHHQKTISGFLNDYIGGSIGVVEQKSGYLGVGQEYNIAEEDILALDVVNIRIDGAASSADQWSQAVRKGRGNIAVFAFDLAAKPLVDWSYRNQAMERMINDILSNKSRAAQSQLNARQLSSSISNVYLNTIPNISHYVVVLLVYIALLPLLYLLLKKRDKRHYIWGAVPALAVVFALVVYVTGTGSRLKNPNLNYLCILTVNDSVAQEAVYMGSTSPRNSPYQFTVSGEYTLSPVGDHYPYYGYGYNRGRSAVTIRQNPSSLAASVSSNASFDTKYFLSERYNDSVGSITLRMEYRQDGHHFAVANHTELTLQNAGIFIPYYGVIPIGQIAPGQTGEYDETHMRFTTYGDLADYLFDGPLDEQSAGRRNQLSNFISYMDDEICLVGFTDDYTPNVGADARIDTAGNTMVVKWAEELAGAQKRYIANISSYTVYDEEQENMALYDPDFYYYAYQFKDMSIESLNLTDMAYCENVAFYNWVSETYEYVFLQGNLLTDVGPYLDEEQKLWAQYEFDYSLDDLVPVISAVATQ